MSAHRPCQTCQGRKGKYVNSANRSVQGIVDSKTWKPCGACNGRGTVR